MTRIEIIANRSVEEDIVEGLEAVMGGFCYTIVPIALGCGRQRYKLGTPTWPEENFLLFAYLDDSAATQARTVVSRIKERFPTEGIKFFSVPGAI